MPSQTIEELLKQDRYGQDLYNYLQHRKSVPTVSIRPLWVNGEYFPANNHINLSPNSGLGTLFHETTHAADTALEKQYWDRKTSWGNPNIRTPFTDAYIKLVKGDNNNRIRSLNPRESLAKLLDAQWYKENRDYRSTKPELAGWAGGRTITPERQYKVPNHLDATLATEMSILMDLARRADTPYPKQPSWFDKLFSN